MIGYIGIETSHNDGRKTFRFVEVSSKSAMKKALAFASEQARRFEAKPGVTGTRLVNVATATRKRSDQLAALPSMDEW